MSGYEKILLSAREKKLICEEDECALFIDLELIDVFLDKIKSSFPKNAQHYIPIKTNPLNAIQKHVLSKGFGLEASTINEVHLALLNGAKAHQVVLNSPAKGEFFYKKNNLVLKGINLHLNDLKELDFLNENQGFNQILRINPLTKSSSKKEFFVSSGDSKFGHQISDLELFVKNVSSSNITGLHVHQASSFSDFSEQIKGIRFVVDLALKINKTKQDQIKTVNIGGGFPGIQIEDIGLFSEYIDALKKTCPELFDGTFIVASEFGRFVYSNSAFLYSQIAAIKQNENNSSLVINSGANLFLREVYSDTPLKHEQILLLNEAFKALNSNDKKKYNIDGPLCFAGDRLCSKILLPEVASSDKVIIKNIGANTFSLYSMHCSKSFPKVIAYNNLKMEIIKDEQTIEDIHAFWGKI